MFGDKVRVWTCKERDSEYVGIRMLRLGLPGGREEDEDGDLWTCSKRT